MDPKEEKETVFKIASCTSKEQSLPAVTSVVIEKSKEKDRCKICNKQVNEGIECEVCEHWFHARCVNLTTAAMKALESDKSIHWCCEGCGNGVVMMWKKFKERQDKMEMQMSVIHKEVEGIKRDASTRQVKTDKDIGMLKKEITGIKDEFDVRKKVEEMKIWKKN